MTVEILHRGRFDAVEGATVRSVGPNAYEVRLPLDDRAVQRTRRPATHEGFDEVVLTIDGAESEPGVVAAIGRDSVTITVWIL